MLVGCHNTHNPLTPQTRQGAHMATRLLENEERLLTTGEVAALWRVEPKTVTRWARKGKLNAIRTLGGHRRFRETEVRALLAEIDPAPEN